MSGQNHLFEDWISTLYSHYNSDVYTMSKPCVFCSPNSDIIVFSNDHAYLRFDDYPVTPGHMLIIPFRHIRSFFEISDDELTSLWELARLGKQYLDTTYHPEGYNIAVNDGVVAGQTVMHLHIHLIPRYPGDLTDPKAWVHEVLQVSEKMLEVKDNSI